MADMFDNTPDYWDGMPEFVQEAKPPFTQIIVRFETEEDMKAFSELIGQTVTARTKSIWYPEWVRGKDNRGKRWVDAT